MDWGSHKVTQWWSDWGGYGSGGYSGGSELVRKLAIALKAINATVSVINDTGKRYRVELAHDDDGSPMSYTSYDEHLIVVSPQALLDTTIDQGEAIEITTGWGMHEASHPKYSEPIRDALTVPTTLRPLAVAGLMHNVLEDLRIEHLTGLKFPGFAEYFDVANAYLWGVTKDKVPTTWGPELGDKINAIIGMAKWPTEYEPFAMADPELAAQWPWWREWAEAYVANKEPIRMGIIRALEKLAEDPQTARQMADMTDQEKQFESAEPGTLTDEQFGDLLKQLKEALGNGLEPCPSPSRQRGGPTRPIQLTEEQGKELEKLMVEQYSQEESTYKMTEGVDNVSPMIEVMRPQETDWSRDMYHAPGGMVERLRSVFFFRKVAASDTERLLRTGLIDEEELWRAGTGDPRVFERTTQPEENYASVTMLVDASGSMNGRGLIKAQELANVMMACLRTQRGCRTRVRGHTTGQVGDSQTSVIYRIWEPGDRDTRLGLLTTVPHGANFDGFAIDWCARELATTAEPNETKLLIVLSDGLPNGNISANGTHYHYGGEAAMRHMWGVGDYWAKQGVEIVQIAIDHNGIRPEDQARMFRHWIGYETDNRLLTDLTKLLAKTFGGEV